MIEDFSGLRISFTEIHMFQVADGRQNYGTTYRNLLAKILAGKLAARRRDGGEMASREGLRLVFTNLEERVSCTGDQGRRTSCGGCQDFKVSWSRLLAAYDSFDFSPAAMPIPDGDMNQELLNNPYGGTPVGDRPFGTLLRAVVRHGDEHG